MHLDQRALFELAELAGAAARRAGAYTQSRSQDGVEVLRKSGGDTLASQVVTEVDEQAQALILDTLAPATEAHDLAILTEESADDGSRLKKDYFWCIDPLDGTLPFTRGLPGYAVSIALVRRDGRPVIGVVYDPAKDRMFRAVQGGGIEIDGVFPTTQGIARGQKRLLFCYDCTFADDPQRESVREQMDRLAAELGYGSAEIHIGGGAVLNACHVLEHPPAIYFKRPKPKLGGGSFWDFAATACLFEEAGAHVSDFSGQALQLNRPGGTFMNHCGICYATDAELALSFLQRIGSGGIL